LLLDRVPEPGEWVLAHAGHALAVLTDADAADALTVRARMEEGPG
jgi:hydrogenase maturation factor